MQAATPKLEAARKRQVAVKAASKPSGMRTADGSDAHRALRVDKELFHNAINNYRDEGVRNVWDEPEFVDDMVKRHPELACDVERNTARVGYTGGGETTPRKSLGLGYVFIGGRYYDKRTRKELTPEEVQRRKGPGLKF